jgi:hypothetical protein
MNFCSHFPYSLTDLGEIRFWRCPRNVAGQLLFGESESETVLSV